MISDIHTILQTYIVILGVSSAWLISSDKPRLRLIGFMIAIANQPAWLVSAWYAGQFGVLIMALYYTVWIRGALLILKYKGAI